jgi:hypothetical protein
MASLLVKYVMRVLRLSLFTVIERTVFGNLKQTKKACFLQRHIQGPSWCSSALSFLFASLFYLLFSLQRTLFMSSAHHILCLSPRVCAGLTCNNNPSVLHAFKQTNNNNNEKKNVQLAGVTETNRKGGCTCIPRRTFAHQKRNEGSLLTAITLRTHGKEKEPLLLLRVCWCVCHRAPPFFCCDDVVPISPVVLMWVTLTRHGRCERCTRFFFSFNLLSPFFPGIVASPFMILPLLLLFLGAPSHYTHRLFCRKKRLEPSTSEKTWRSCTH